MSSVTENNPLAADDIGASVETIRIATNFYKWADNSTTTDYSWKGLKEHVFRCLPQINPGAFCEKILAACGLAYSAHNYEKALNSKQLRGEGCHKTLIRELLESAGNFQTNGSRENQDKFCNCIGRCFTAPDWDFDIAVLSALLHALPPPPRSE